MKLTFKDLKQQRFTIDAEPSDTIGSLKEKISAEKGWEPASQKLIYSGKILQDDKTVESYGVEEKGFIVCMISKPKVATSKAAEPSTPAKVASTPAAPSAPAPAPAAQAPIPQVPATPSPLPAQSTTTASGTPATFNDPSALAMGSEREAVIANMEAMGFERSQINRAMQAAFSNPDRAIDYLLNGIPEGLTREPRPAAQAPATQTSSTASTTIDEPAESEADDSLNLFEQAAAASAGRRGGAERSTEQRSSADTAREDEAFAAIAANPQFRQLRQLVQSQPAMLEPILQQLSTSDPNLARMITRNPERFLQLLAMDGEDDESVMPAGQTVAVSEAERDAIDRLVRLGFQRDMVIQAYFACDKNEELAANFLFDQPDDDED